MNLPLIYRWRGTAQPSGKLQCQKVHEQNIKAFRHTYRAASMTTTARCKCSGQSVRRTDDELINVPRRSCQWINSTPPIEYVIVLHSPLLISAILTVSGIGYETLHDWLFLVSLAHCHLILRTPVYHRHRHHHHRHHFHYASLGSLLSSTPDSKRTFSINPSHRRFPHFFQTDLAVIRTNFRT